MDDWQTLLRKRETPETFVVEGRFAVDRLLASEYEVLRTLVVGTDLTRAQASELTGYPFHRGVLALARKPPNPALSALISTAPLVVLPEIADPGNLGTIIRNTAALGGSGVLLGKGCSPFNAKAVRSSAGTLFSLPFRRSEDLLTDLKELRQTHHLLATALTPVAVPLTEISLPPRPLALLLGAEDFGLSPEVLSLCDQQTYLPMARSIDSLNVASSSAIFLYHLQRG